MASLVATYVELASPLPTARCLRPAATGVSGSDEVPDGELSWVREIVETACALEFRGTAHSHEVRTSGISDQGLELTHVDRTVG
jgi:hypothetical protein